MSTQDKYALQELNFETTLGGLGDVDENRDIPLIDLSDFDRRKTDITEQLWQAAKDVGFFQLINHGISLDEIDAAFAMSEAFFALPRSVKKQYPLKDGLNAGWEYRAQVRPSTGTADEKESYQFTIPHMEGLWPDDTVLAGFQSLIEAFEWKAWQLNMQVLSCFATKLGFDENFFAQKHERGSPEYQSTLRLLHYLPLVDSDIPEGVWRAGAHTDFDCLTMVFQQEGQGGLQVCAGKTALQSQTWTSVLPRRGVITCNIGDMLMRWSDDELLSTLHRVRMPAPNENHGSRYSIAFFAQANKDQIIQGPGRKYPAISARDYMRHRLNANFSGKG
ncbi:MAG: 2-oxoglutarate and iron-dependent oxygenase domain-containing protein [Reinekea sp.]|nr:2-oxoglutarate and iron-dependent oxygenase domain-containing protein [Reinekea sp.]